MQLIQASDPHLSTAGTQALPWTFDASHIAALEEVASGAYGVVYRGRCPGKTSDVAVKIAKAIRSGRQKEAERRLQAEAALLANVQHEGIVAFMGELQCAEGTGLVMAWADGGEVLSYLKSGGGTARKTLLADVVSALAYIHSLVPPIVHGDVHPRNILVYQDRAVLADFGLSVVCKDGVKVGSGASGRLDYQAPEVLAGPGGKSPASDVYAWGILSVELYSGTPWIQSRWPRACLEIVLHEARPCRPDDIEEDIWQAAQQCWQAEATKRPSADRVYGWLKG
ncbi:kinase-like protein [Exidia glandulosa HHB12029]|uniref:Kinase-like protein n=1 Tax=Exidia glandulosa HHB12029 TaxID=1314781 RepID=A0A165R0M7_EXIGL|nr:kinase-like protein [Exidia glandulosa HHB12029]